MPLQSEYQLMHIPKFGVFLNFLRLFLTLIIYASVNITYAKTPGRFAGKGITIGLEYAGLDSPAYVKGMADALSNTRMPGMKHYAEAIAWGEMQKGPNKPIDFSKLDLFVREYQKVGFTELTVALKSHSKWADKDGNKFKSTNPTPKKQYENLYRNWIQTIVERYDADGKNDMPGLRWPVRYYEIGSEFSSYEPEPVEDYLAMLSIAYDAAHAAYTNVQVAHAAFLTTPVNLNVESPSDYESVWKNTKRHDKHHGLADIRSILDRPDLFDVINIHNLGDPYEIEHVTKWLNYEMAMRNYQKEKIISDTIPTSYIAWGPATNCKARVQGILIPPASENDRCKLADYFKKLVSKDKKTLKWTREFIAADHVQRTLIAAEQGYKLINLSFTIDLPFLTTKFMKAGAGISAWAGTLVINRNGRIRKKRPLYYSIQQLVQHINNYDRIQRIKHHDSQVRLYKLQKNGKRVWVAWLQQDGIYLPEHKSMNKKVKLSFDENIIEVEELSIDKIAPKRKLIPINNGEYKLTLKHSPIYIFAK
ncbi:MAG: hypothetical protein AAF304_00740 [Pseudomonadota bacterium]